MRVSARTFSKPVSPNASAHPAKEELLTVLVQLLLGHHRQRLEDSKHIPGFHSFHQPVDALLRVEQLIHGGRAAEESLAATYWGGGSLVEGRRRLGLRLAAS